MKSYDDGVTSGSYDYDINYRKILETINYGAFELSNSYTYYKNGMKKTFTGPDAITYTYGYDDNNQLAVVQIPGVGLISYDEYFWNRPTAMTLPGGSAKEFTYDPLMRIESITVKDPMQTVLMDYEYSYDRMDNIVGKTTEHGDYVYSYDDLYRLTSVDNPALDDEGFTYDSVGNRLTSLDVVGDWGYNQNNELEAYDGVSFQYDANGNTIQKNNNGTITNYIYNVENRLTRVEDGAGSVVAEYYYDPFGRRLFKDAGGVKTYYHYADEGLIGEYDGAGAEIKKYGYRPNSTWTTDPLFLKQNSNYYFYHNDHLGTPQKMTGISGNIVWSAKYESFGEATIEIEAVVNNLRFPGQYFDGETGLCYNWYRDYHSGLGRYVEIDPIGVAGGLNLHLYAGNSPVVSMDMVGLKKKYGWSCEPECKWKGIDKMTYCWELDKCCRDLAFSKYLDCGKPGLLPPLPGWIGEIIDFIKDWLVGPGVDWVDCQEQYDKGLERCDEIWIEEGCNNGPPTEL